MLPKENPLVFQPVTIKDYDSIFPYTSSYGEGSCQHSPVSMISLSEKYGDSVCIREKILYTLRTRLCDDKYRVYLAPLGGNQIDTAYRIIMSDAASHGKRVKFITLTEKHVKLIENVFPGCFVFREERDLAEYHYRTDRMASFPGGELRKRRQEVHTFWNQYGMRATIDRIHPHDYEDCLRYKQKWLRDNLETHDAEALLRDSRMIEYQISNFEALHLSGVILRIDGAVHGFCYGTRLGDTYDVIVEKADRSIPHCYKVLRQESTKQCAADCTFVNMEEDLGMPGLRALKMAYKPDRLMRKYIVTERE